MPEGIGQDGETIVPFRMCVGHELGYTPLSVSKLWQLFALYFSKPNYKCHRTDGNHHSVLPGYCRSSFQYGGHTLASISGKQESSKLL